jgi:hypothetical protein
MWGAMTTPDAFTIQSSQSGLLVRWPDYLVDWQLEQSSDLAIWSDVTERIRLRDDSFEFAPAVEQNSFFRLREMAPQ